MPPPPTQPALVMLPPPPPRFVGLPPPPPPQRSVSTSPPTPVRYFGRDLAPVRRPPTFASHVFRPPPPYRAVAPPQHQAGLLHTSPPGPTSVGTAVTIQPQQDVRRRVVLPADTPAITSSNHKYNKNHQHETTVGACDGGCDAQRQCGTATTDRPVRNVEQTIRGCGSTYDNSNNSIN